MGPRFPSRDRRLAPLLAFLLIVQGAVGALLDREPVGSGPGIETEHHAASCVRGHDHSVCGQMGANLPLPPHPTRTVAQAPPSLLQRPRSELRSAAALHLVGLPSRAPPRG